MCIARSVGRGGVNEAADVKTIQVLLNLNQPRLGPLAPLAVDGAIGEHTIEAIETFQASEVVMAAPSGVVDPQSPTLKALAAGMPPGLSAEKIQGIMIHAAASTVATFADRLIAKMAARGIDVPLRQSHFLAQVGHESGELRFRQEIASGQQYEGRKDLGNTEPGDGPRFKGRGLIQLTGRANYRAYGAAIGVDLLSNNQWERVATDADLAVDVACWFWQTHDLNPFADADDLTSITRKINGGLNGFDDRQRQLARSKFFLSV
jgi:putative chitinase